MKQLKLFKEEENEIIQKLNSEIKKRVIKKMAEIILAEFYIKTEKNKIIEK